MSLDSQIAQLRVKGFSFSEIGEALNITKDKAQKRYMRLDADKINLYTQGIRSEERILSKEVDNSNIINTNTSYGSSVPHFVKPADPVVIDYIPRVGDSPSSSRGNLVVCAGDFQFPFEDADVFASFLTFLAAERPERIVLTGDILDLTSVSSYDKDPRLGLPVQDEIAYAHRRLAEIRAASGPDTKIYFLYGNHEARFSKWLAKKAPELVGLTDADGREMLSLATLLRFDYLDIIPCIDEKTIYTGPESLRSYYKITEDLIATHGTYSRSTGGGSSIAPIADAAGVSVVGGHDHSQGIAFRTIGGFAELQEKRIAAISTGMMCLRTDLGYLAQHQVSRWSAGFAVIELWGDKAGEWQPDFASWTGSEIAWRGKRYSSK
jgi:hypothetical protein